MLQKGYTYMSKPGTGGSATASPPSQSKPKQTRNAGQLTVAVVESDGRLAIVPNTPALKTTTEVEKFISENGDLFEGKTVEIVVRKKRLTVKRSVTLESSQ